ncbi:GntR family transcriptional regulator [Lentilactobacillus diolivorans]|uniref:GntR family transcriptional regulator n=2 Tax=Lentilactobacillus diolivorans TaxID=179838 RepID=A0A0R1S891_9LACO|nr:GntR family transcriptional regulator [Lentilactobacillus diolivorans]KRL65152.1 GntR family transcriptional regulator [Lentilactobacillus diolivorans DSM 14421]GEP24393.1 GntR family transcriptional regulator [Lentilactobacillus diolivorans]
METKYVKVKKSIKSNIINGKYKINEKIPTESELMAMYSVSRYTIRRAVGDLEHEGYIYRVQGGGMYVNDWINKKVSADRSNQSVGVVTTHIADYIFPNIISGIDQVISEQGLSILIGNTHDEYDNERHNLLNMLDNDVVGFIIEPTRSTLENPNLDVYQMIVESGKPAVFINAHYPQLDFPYVEIDDTECEKKLMDYLLDNGHEQVLGVFQVDDLQGVNRMNGFIKSYQTHPQVSSSGDIMMYRSSDDINNVLDKVKDRVISPDVRPTAIVCYNDQLAIEVIGMLSKEGISVPDDISVAGFDDYEISKYIDPGLTTMVHPKREMGTTAAKLLLDMLKKGDGSPKILDSKLIIRNSTKTI